MTLTIELDLDIIEIHSCAKSRVCMSNGSGVRELNDRHTHTHRWTDGTDFIPSTADVGGKKAWLRNHFNTNKAWQGS